MASTFPYFGSALLAFWRDKIPYIDGRYDASRVIGSPVDDDQTHLVEYERYLSRKGKEQCLADGSSAGVGTTQVSLPFAVLIRQLPKHAEGGRQVSAATFAQRDILIKRQSGPPGNSLTMQAATADVEVPFQLVFYENNSDDLMEFMANWLLKLGWAATRFMYTVQLENNQGSFELPANLVVQDGEQTVRASFQERRDSGIVYKTVFQCVARTAILISPQISKIILDPNHTFILDNPEAWPQP